MKEYIKFLVVVFLLLGINKTATAQSTRPTIKVGVFYTAKAAELANGTTVNATVNTRISTLENLMAGNGLQASYDIKLTALGLLNTYVEPKYRSRKAGDNTYGTDEYISIDGDGTQQVFQEIILHESFKKYYQSAEDNQDDIPGTLDDDLQYDALDEDEIDISFTNQAEYVAPDVIIIIADEEGESFVADQSIRNVSSAYNKSLYIVLRADYFYDEDESLAYAFFNLFSDPGYSDADLGSDDPGVYSFLSDYWTGVEGTDLLSETNVELFKYNVGKLKLATANSGQIVFDGTTDLTFQYAQTVQDVNSATAIVFDGSNQDFAVAIPAATLANESNSGSDIYGNEVKIANSFMAFTSGEYTLDPTQETDPRSDNTPSTTPYTPPSFSLPIDFDNDIIASKKNQYISNYFGANASVTDGTTTNKDFLTITKFKGASNACAETIIQNISGLTLSTSSKKLQIDVKLGTNASATDEMVMILHADDGSRLVGKIENSGETDLNRKKQLTGATSTGYKTFDVVFNPTGTKTYSSISLRFNNCETGSNDKTYFVDNIKKGADADLKFSNTSVSNNRPETDENITFTFTVKSDIAAASGVKINARLPTGYNLVGTPNATKGTFNSTNGEWTIGSLAKDATATLTIIAQVNSSGQYDYSANITADKDSNNNNNAVTIEVNPENNFDLSVHLINQPFLNVPCGSDAGTELFFEFEVRNKNNGDNPGTVIVEFPFQSNYRVNRTDPFVGTNPVIGDTFQEQNKT